MVYSVLGRPELVGAELIITHYKLPLSVAEFQEQYHQMQLELFTDVKYMPGWEQLSCYAWGFVEEKKKKNTKNTFFFSLDSKLTQ